LAFIVAIMGNSFTVYYSREGVNCEKDVSRKIKLRRLQGRNSLIL